MTEKNKKLETSEDTNEETNEEIKEEIPVTKEIEKNDKEIKL